MKHLIEDKFEKKLAEKYLSYILITCAEPDESGSMKVEMSYVGDTVTVSYLIECAQSLIEDKVNNELDSTPDLANKIHQL